MEVVPDEGHWIPTSRFRGLVLREAGEFERGQKSLEASSVASNIGWVKYGSLTSSNIEGSNWVVRSSKLFDTSPSLRRVFGSVGSAWEGRNAEYCVI